MEYAVGAVMGLAIGVFATVVGLDRDRALYPVAMIVIGSYYDLFAVMGGSNEALILESVVGLAFIIAAVVGFKRNLWIVAVAIIGHGVFDIGVHQHVVNNPGLPTFWPGFCSSIDIVLGLYMAWILYSGRLKAAGDH